MLKSLNVPSDLLGRILFIRSPIEPLYKVVSQFTLCAMWVQVNIGTQSQLQMSYQLG
jgi:hypothetical protein